MKTISTNDLEQVTGGKGTPTANVANTSGGGGDNDQILSALQGIQSSLKDIGKNNNGLFGGNNGLMFMTMALAMSRRNDVVVSGGGNCCGRGRASFSWRAYW